MSIESVMEKSPSWESDADAPHTGTVVLSLCNVARNLADVPFPAGCRSDDLVAVEERMLNAFGQLDLLSSGQYFSLAALSPSEIQILAERQLITLAMTTPRKGQGLYISGDQCLCILVNDEDHCCVRVLAGGLNLQEAWKRASLMDDALNDILDFAFSKKLGFLTRNLNHVGTGLKLSLLMHLPACVHDGVLHDVGVLHEIGALADGRDLVFTGVGTGMPDRQAVQAAERGGRWPYYSQALYNSMNGFVARGLLETEGDLFQLRNRTSLGPSEEELVFKLKQCAGEIIVKETELRERLRDQSADILEDRIDRARALATNARLMPFDESFTLLSSLRLGVTLGLISDRTVADLNGTLIHCQGAHVERQLQPGVDTLDELSLKRLRARQFKQLFTPVQG